MSVKQCRKCGKSFNTEASKTREFIGFENEITGEFYRRLPIILLCDDCLLNEIIAESQRASHTI